MYISGARGRTAGDLGRAVTSRALCVGLGWFYWLRSLHRRRYLCGTRHPISRQINSHSEVSGRFDN